MLLQLAKKQVSENRFEMFDKKLLTCILFVNFNSIECAQKVRHMYKLTCLKIVKSEMVLQTRMCPKT